jgi:hypothetical protein
MKTPSSYYLSLQRSLRILFFICLVLSMYAPISGQTVTGDLEVRVVDVNGAIIPGVTVTITDQDTGQSQTQVTSDDGVARFTNLKPGTYRVSVEQPGFVRKSVDKLRVTVGGAQTLEIPLETTGTGQQVTVTAGGGEREEELAALPNLNNDLTPVLQVVPGAVATGSSALGKIIIDGKGKEQQVVKLDGVDATSMVSVPSGDSALDVVSSFQKPEVAFNIGKPGTNSGAFSPAVGPGTGVVVENLTYEGVNDWRGQIYGEQRNDALNARNFFDFDGKNAIRRTRFGGKVGGRLIKDRVFLYLAYDGVRGRTESTIYEAVPVDALCVGGCGGPVGPFMSGFLTAGTEVMPAGASLNPDFLIARRRARSSVEANAFNVRVDHKDNLFFRFTRQVAENVVPDGVTGRLQRQRIFFNNAAAQYKLIETNFIHTFTFGLNETSARINAELGANTSPDLAQSLLSTAGTIGTVGLPGNRSTLSVAALGGLIKDVGRGFDLRPVSYIAGYGLEGALLGQKLFLGVEARFIRVSFDKLGGLAYAFPDVASLRAGTPGSTTFLSDLSGPSPFTAGTGLRHARQQYYLSYFQMVSQLSPRLALTYGLRYDYFGAARERDNRAVVVDPQTGDILAPGSQFYRTRRSNFQPRVGLDYQLAGTGFFSNTVLRAGAGIYSGVPRIGDLLLPIESDRFSTGMMGGAFPVLPGEVIRSFQQSPETRQFQPLAFARDFSTPERVYKWEASLTQTFKGIYDFMILYAGNAGRSLALAGVANQIVRVVDNPDPTRPATAIRQFDIIRENQVFEPFGEFFYRSSDGRSSYNGLSVQLSRNKATSTSLPSWLNPGSLSVQYTLSRNVGNASGAVASNPLNFDSDYGYNAVDARHSFTFSAVYNLWEVANSRRSSLLWGWRLAPSVNARSGFPLVVRIDRPDIVYADSNGSIFSSPAVGRRAVINTPGGGASGGTRVPDLLPGVNPYLGNGIELLNPLAFAIPAPGSFGNLRRGQLRGPASLQFDLSVTRYLFRRESVMGEFRVDFFNLFNRANFSNPTASLPNALGTSTQDNQIQPGVAFTRPAAGAFGIINAADTARQIQFSFTLKFNDGFTK